LVNCSYNNQQFPIFDRITINRHCEAMVFFLANGYCPKQSVGASRVTFLYRQIASYDNFR